MTTFPPELVSPERILFSGEVEQVVVPASEGEVTILAQHAPFMSALRPGVVSISERGGTARRLVVIGGFCDVSPTGLTLLAEQAVAVEDIDVETLSQRMRDAEEDLRDAKSEEMRVAAAAKLDGLRIMMAAVRN